MSFGKKLKTLRQNHNMTQEALAKKINLSKANISKYEADTIEPSLETLVIISKLFNVSIDYLLGVSNEDSSPESSIPDDIQTLISSYSDLSEEELKKVMEYVDFLKTKRK